MQNYGKSNDRQKIVIQIRKPLQEKPLTMSTAEIKACKNYFHNLQSLRFFHIFANDRLRLGKYLILQNQETII